MRSLTLSSIVAMRTGSRCNIATVVTLFWRDTGELSSHADVVYCTLNCSFPSLFLAFFGSLDYSALLDACFIPVPYLTYLLTLKWKWHTLPKRRLALIMRRYIPEGKIPMVVIFKIMHWCDVVLIPVKKTLNKRTLKLRFTKKLKKLI
jgi:hypothetical protein